MERKKKKPDLDIPGMSGKEKKQQTYTSIRRQQVRKAAEEYKILPLDFWLAALNDEENDFSLRNDCAKSAAPYVHRKMPIGLDDGNGGPVSLITPQMLAKLSDQELQLFQNMMLKLAKATGEVK